MEVREVLFGAVAGFIIAVLAVAPGKGKYQVISNNNDVVTILNTATGHAWLAKVKTDSWYADNDYLKALFYQNYYDETNLDAQPSSRKTPYEGSWIEWLKYKVWMKWIEYKAGSRT